MEVFIFIFIVLWYMSGLLASHFIITLGEHFTWTNAWPMGLTMALFGPFNFAGVFAVW